MDFHLKQWRNQQHESEEEDEQQPPSAKIPKLLLDPPLPPHEELQEQQQYSICGSSTIAAPLPLFVPAEHNSNNKVSNLSAFTDHSTATTRFPRMGGNGYFSLAQWQELELQALIYRYMLAGAAIPPELLQPIKKSLLLLNSPPYFLHHPLQHYSYYQPSLLQTGYWGRGAMDPEPGRCRRTDGKKWRCSRDVVAGQKYCERHVHRGRNRSRKPVEIPTPNSSTISTTNANSTGIGGGRGGGGGAAAFNNSRTSPLSGVTSGTSFSFSGQSPSNDLLHLNNSSSDSKHEIKGLLLGTQKDVANSRNDGRILRHFFDDWPRDSAASNASPMNSATSLSISMPGNSSSDVSLKLSTGNEEEPVGSRGDQRVHHPQVNWTGGWGTNQVSSMGGPLAEALRSSTSNSSPTSVLHQLPRGSASETVYVST